MMLDPPPADPPHILVVDDDTRLRELLRKFLTENGFAVTVAANAAEARERLRAVCFDLIVLDLMMPGESGLDFAASLRGAGDRVPILMLTAMAEADDRVRGLENGADDYLVKPFDPRELVLRLNSILRRVPPSAVAAVEIRFGPITFDRRRRTLTRGGSALHLTEAEAALLAALAETPGVALSRDELSQRADAGGGRTVDVQVTRLRRKIEPDPRHPRYLLTVRGRGYALRPDD